MTKVHLLLNFCRAQLLSALSRCISPPSKAHSRLSCCGGRLLSAQLRIRLSHFNESASSSFSLTSVMASVHLLNGPNQVWAGRLPTIQATYGICLIQKKHIKSFLKDEKENASMPESIGSCSRRVILILPVVSSGLFHTYSAHGKAKINLFNENRLLEQNKKIQEANQAPKDFPNFIREGFQVKVVTSDKYVKCSSGLIYLDIQVGNGDCPKDGQQVTFHYTGYNESGRRIDSSYLQGSPAKIRLGNNALVPGFEEGIHDMRPGGKRRIIIPPELGPPVGPGTFFSSKQFEVFDVELLNIKDCQRRTIAFYSDVICN